MRKAAVSILSLCLLGCSSSAASGHMENKQGSSVDQVLETQAAEANGQVHQSGIAENAPKPQPAESAKGENAEGIDVDLTVMPPTMVYSEVYSMITSPKFYTGKTVKMRGIYSHFHDGSTDKDYFACIIQDAMECCAQGIEFILTDDYRYPEDYPAEGASITVTGVFDTYTEGENRYVTLREAELIHDEN